MTAPEPRAAAAPRRARRAPSVAASLALLAFFVYALTGGGRVVGSDEVTMLELSRAMLNGHIAVPEGATLSGVGGLHYTKNAAGQAVAALPIVAVAEFGARAVGLDPARRVLAVRFAASFFNAAVCALLLACLYTTARGLGASAGGAVAAALLLGLATPVWVYAKSFMAEPLQALGLLLALSGSARAGAPREPGARGIPPELTAAAGAFIAVSAKLSMLPLAFGCLVPLLGARRRSSLLPLAGVGMALVGHAAYDMARFGTPFETGYGAQATAAAYSTPFLVGLYGLILSSGKGLLWFAPPVWLAPAGWRVMRAGGHGPGHDSGRVAIRTPAGRAAWGIVAACAAALALYARFQHWAGDGSFGPRYLVPVLPLVLLPVAFALTPRPGRSSTGRRVVAWILGLLGVLVQIGGVGIYFGAQMREAGDYPYPLPLDHPRFMSDSHWNPRFTPIAGHWRMLARNVSEHLRGELPRISPGAPGEGDDVHDARLGLSAADQSALLHAIDVWWLYLAYAGYGGWKLAVAPLVLVVLSVWAARLLLRALAAETRAP